MAPSPQAQAGGDMAVKTSTEGADVGGGAGGGSTGAGENVPQAAAKQDAAVVRRNIGKVAKPGFTERIGTEISGAEQALQSEANKYVQGAQQQHTLGEDVYGQAIGGSQEAQGKISGLLGRSAEAESKAYKEFQPQTNVNISDVEALKSGAGIGELLRKEAGPSLTAREIALDRSILERSPEFIKIKNQLLGQQAALRKTGADLSESETAKARQAVMANITAAQEGARKGLGGQESAIKSAIEQRAAEENAARAALRAGGGGDFAKQQADAAQAELQKELTDPQGAAKYLQQALGGVDASKFYEVGADIGAGDITSQEEASKFNLINQLLGRGDVVQAGAGPSARESFKGAEYTQAAKAAAEELDRQANVKAQSRMDEILADAKKRAGQQNAVLEAMRGGKIDDSIMRDRYGIESDIRGRFGEDALTRAGIDPRQFVNVAQNIDYQQMLGADQASELNAALEELSRTNDPRFSAGAGPGARGTFNADAYRSALEQMLARSEDPEMRGREKVVGGLKQAYDAAGQMASSVDKATGGLGAGLKRSW